MIQNRFAVEHNSKSFAIHGDDKAVPFADGIVCKLAWGDAFDHLGCLALVGAVAIHFTRADGPVPHVDLAFGTATKIDTAVPRIVDFDLFFTAVFIQGHGSV